MVEENHLQDSLMDHIGSQAKTPNRESNGLTNPPALWLYPSPIP
jgi:hypothetical protein